MSLASILALTSVAGQAQQVVALPYRPSPSGPEAIAAKARANAAADKVQAVRAQVPVAEPSATGGGPTLQLAAGDNPRIVNGLNFAGQASPGVSVTTPDTAGAIGTTRYVQAVTDRAAIYNRTTGGVIKTGTLNELGNQPSDARSFSPQLIWDAETERFYYAMTSIKSNGKSLAFGFSKTASPNNLTTDWCHYESFFGTRLPDFARPAMPNP